MENTENNFGKGGEKAVEQKTSNPNVETFVLRLERLREEDPLRYEEVKKMLEKRAGGDEEIQPNQSKLFASLNVENAQEVLNLVDASLNKKENFANPNVKEFAVRLHELREEESPRYNQIIKTLYNRMQGTEKIPAGQSKPYPSLYANDARAILQEVAPDFLKKVENLQKETRAEVAEVLDKPATAETPENGDLAA